MSLDLYEAPDRDYVEAEWQAVEKAARFRDSGKKKDKKDRFKKLDYSWYLKPSAWQPAPRVNSSGVGPEERRSIGIRFGNEKLGYGPKQETLPAWKWLPPRWVPWVEKATREFEKDHPEPKERKPEDAAGYNPVDMEPRKLGAELGVVGEITGYQWGKAPRADIARRSLRDKNKESRSRAKVREQTKGDPVLLVHALTADRRAKCAKLFSGDAVAARAGLLEYALLPDEDGVSAPPVMHPMASADPEWRGFLPSWGGSLQFEARVDAITGRVDLLELPRRPFGNDPLQGYTRKKTRISGAVAIAMKDEEFAPDEKLLAIVDLGGGARIGLRKKELTKSEIVVKVEPLDKLPGPLVVTRGLDDGEKKLGIVVSKKVLHKAIPTRTLYAHAESCEAERLVGDKQWKGLLTDNRATYQAEKKAAEWARVVALRDAMLARLSDDGEWQDWLMQKESRWNPLLGPERPRWARPIVKERIRRPPVGAVEGHLWLRKHG